MNADDGNGKQNGTIPASLRFIRTVLSPRNRIDFPEDFIRFARKFPRNMMMGRVIR